MRRVFSISPLMTSVPPVETSSVVKVVGMIWSRHVFSVRPSRVTSGTGQDAKVVLTSAAIGALGQGAGVGRSRSRW